MLWNEDNVCLVFNGGAFDVIASFCEMIVLDFFSAESTQTDTLYPECLLHTSNVFNIRLNWLILCCDH